HARTGEPPPPAAAPPAPPRPPSPLPRRRRTRRLSADNCRLPPKRVQAHRLLGRRGTVVPARRPDRSQKTPFRHPTSGVGGNNDFVRDAGRNILRRVRALDKPITCNDANRSRPRGGTKIEIIAIDGQGIAVHRWRTT